MSTQPSPYVLIAQADRLYAGCLHAVMVDLHPHVEVLQVASLVEATRVLTDRGFCEFLLCGVRFRDGDVLGWLTEVQTSRRARKVLVVTGRKEPPLLAALRDIRVNGVFDAFEQGIPDLRHAVLRIESNHPFVSPSLSPASAAVDDPGLVLLRRLTIKEQLVFSAVGDGSDDQEAARRLAMTPAAVRSHRKRIHAKLGLSHRGELIRLALTHGFVRVDHGKIVRPTFAHLWARSQRRRKELGADASPTEIGFTPRRQFIGS